MTLHIWKHKMKEEDKGRGVKMKKKLEGVFREDSDVLLDNGFHIKYVTKNHNSPPHWHRALEILYILNGRATVKMDGKKYKLNPQDMLVIDSTKVHDVVYALPQTMGITIHISKNFLRKYIADIELMKFECNKESLKGEQQDSYERLCGYMKRLTVIYIEQKQSYELKSNAYVLDILSELVDYFSMQITENMTVSSYNKLARMEQIYHYVEEHHSEEITLENISSELGLNREYFCRMFKKNMGISFISYVNQGRIDHIYRDLIYTDDSIQEITERHGFYNQKLFYKMFKERYQCTPLKLRKIASETE